MLVTQLLLVAFLILAPADGTRERPWCSGGSALCTSVIAESTYDHRALTSGNGLVYTFGGRKGGGQSEIFTPDKLYELEPRSLVLRAQTLSGWQDVPGRAGHSMVEWVDSAGRRHLVVFGGVAYVPTDLATSQEQLLADVADISLSTFAWTKHNTTGSGPSPRKFATAALWRSDVMLVFGGVTSSGAWSNEVWGYNITQRRWLGQLPNASSAPLGRGSAALAVRGGYLLLYAFPSPRPSRCFPAPAGWGWRSADGASEEPGR